MPANSCPMISPWHPERALVGDPLRFGAAVTGRFYSNDFLT